MMIFLVNGPFLSRNQLKLSYRSVRNRILHKVRFRSTAWFSKQPWWSTNRRSFSSELIKSARFTAIGRPRGWSPPPRRCCCPLPVPWRPPRPDAGWCSRWSPESRWAPPPRLIGWSRAWWSTAGSPDHRHTSHDLSNIETGTKLYLDIMTYTFDIIERGHFYKFSYYFVLWRICKHLLCETAYSGQ